jgi:Flp pilus assembly pilin Flp
MESINRYIGQFVREDEGQDVVEYGLLIVGIAFVVLVGVNAFGAALNAWFGAIAGGLPNP